MPVWFDDAKFGLRLLVRNKLLTAVAAVTLALGMGMNTAIFSVVSGALWSTLPYPAPERLIAIWNYSARAGLSNVTVSLMEARDWRQARSIENLAAYRFSQQALGSSGEAQYVQAVEATPELFEVLREKAALGRTFDHSERPAGEHRVAVITESLWRRHFAADPAALGRELKLDGKAYTVIGVMPPGFTFLYSKTEVFLPLFLPPPEANHRGRRGLRVVARLAPGATVEQADAEIQSISKAIEAAHPDTNRGWTGRARPLELDIIDRGARLSIQTMFWAVTGVLLIACANIASLLLARGTLRRRELAIRASLGAARSRLVRLLLTESVLLAGLGGVLGTLFALYAIPVLKSMAPKDFPRLELMKLDPLALGYTFLMCLAAGLIAGLAPAWMLSRGEPAQFLHEGGRGGTASRQRLLHGLVAAEMALALALLVVSGLLIRNLVRQFTADPGFNTQRLLTASVSLPQAHYPERRQGPEFFRGVLERLGRDARIERAAAVQTLPLGGSNSWQAITIEGRRGDPDERNLAGYLVVTPGYFATMEIPLRSGRDFRESDTDAAPGVAVINETMIRRYWPDDPSPLGRRLRFGAADSAGPWITVVGIARDVRHQSPVRPPRPEVYVPLAQAPGRRMVLVARTKGKPAQSSDALRAAVRAMDLHQPLGAIESMDEVLDRRLAGPKVTAQILGFLGTLALLLAAIGTYGVLSYVTSRRAREIGLRLALGAVPADIARLVLGRMLALCAAGLVAGLAAAAALTPLVASLLEGLKPHDPVSFGLPAALLLVTALAAYLAPTLRAVRVDPVRVLREE